MSDMHIVRDYPYPVITVWRALTDPALVPLWTSTGAGGRPEGFAPVGTKFRYIGKPFSRAGTASSGARSSRSTSRRCCATRGQATTAAATTEVAYRLEPHAGGTRFTYEHTGLHRLRRHVHGRCWAASERKMLSDGLPAVLDDLGAPARSAPAARCGPGPELMTAGG